MPFDKPPSYPDACKVVWTTPTKDSSGSMPLGNGYRAERLDGRRRRPLLRHQQNRCLERG